jgi:NAD-dependent deacetylase
MRIGRDTRLVVLTGAGISAESGINTFRDSGGLWENHRMEDVATPAAFKRDPVMVWRFYKDRLKQAKAAKPNAGHLALVKLEQWLGSHFNLITQNVDGLHTAAGSKRVIEMHGSLHSCLCAHCQSRYNAAGVDLEPDLPSCPACGGILRPDIVWFGELPYHMNEIDGLLQNCDAFMVVGTSGVVYPAAGFVMTARYLGAKAMAINLNPIENRDLIDEFHQGRAGDILPRLVEEWMR